MAENDCKSKLKRKKSTAEDTRPEAANKRAPKRAHPAPFSGDARADADRSVVPAAAWWSREQLPAVENLWMLTLKSSLPYLENQTWEPVPDLPHPATGKPTALKLDEQWWCDLNEEVPPFPEPAPPSPKTSSSSDPRSLSTSQQDLSVQTKAVPEPRDRQQSLHSRQSHDGKTTTTLQSLTKKTHPSPHTWEEAASSAGSLNVGREEGRKGGEQEEPRTGAVNRQLTNKMKLHDSRVSLQKEDGSKKKVVEDRLAEEVQAGYSGDGGAAGGGGGLQSCPMCLMVFPTRFTQMDCDGHLAQCLSDMNVDMTW